jgi:hypothetical protein
MVVMAAGLFGPALFAAFVLGLVVTVAGPLVRRQPVEPLWLALAALIAGTFLLYITVTAGVEVRRLLVVAPAMLLFAAAGCRWLEKRFGDRRIFMAALVVIGVVFAATRHPFDGKQPTRYGEAVQALRSEMHGVSGIEPRWMIAADASGEGAFICEVAASERRPTTVVVRGSKLLASALWSGDLYRTRYRSPAEILQLMDSVSVTHAVVRHSDIRGMPHVHDVASVIASSSDWTPIALPAPAPPDLRAYRRKGYESRPQSRIRLDMSYMLNRTIEQ